MKLYYSPGACSLAPHITARELGIPLELVKTDTKKGKTEAGADYSAINPKRYVPVLELDDGQVLTEGPVISQYLADSKPGRGLAPACGTMERYRLQELLGYLNSEIHKTYSPLFNPATPAETRAERAEYLKKRYALVEAWLAKGPYLTGDTFTIADAYLFTLTSWSKLVSLDLSAFPRLLEFVARVAARPAVQEALRAEGLGK